MINVYENVLEEHVALGIHELIKNVSWKYDYPSNTSKPDRHWHVLCGEDGELFFDFDWVDSIWKAANHKFNFLENYGVQKFRRAYMNAHDYGSEPQMHVDDGDFTMIYYPRLDWKVEYGGGTVVNGKLIEYIGNRLIVFNAHLPHQAQSVSRECYDLRTVIVFKCVMSSTTAIEKLVKWQL